MNSKIITLIAVASFVSGSLFAHSKAIKPEYVDMLLKPYFELQASLSKDDLDASKNSANKFKAMLGHGPSAEDAPSMEDLGTEAKKITDASDLATARAAFHVISKDIGKMVEHVGTTGKQDVYKMSCPMAFQGKGGEWLQDSNSLANPYYGASMYSCGSVQAQLAESNSEKAHDSHGTKNHKH